MAAFADREIVAAEGALAIVTGHAALSATGSVMIERLGRGYLSPLWLTRADLMTFVAGHLLVFAVTEPDTKRLHHFGRARVAAQLVASSARRNIAAG